jgi:dihydroorotase
MNRLFIRNATLINEGESFTGSVLIEGEKIRKIYHQPDAEIPAGVAVLDAKGKWLIPGVIDDQVHFREPGLTHKADIASESAAAAAGGVTSFMEMPNTIPQTTNKTELERKYEIASRTSHVNYSFYLGATNDNIEDIKRADPRQIPGIKVFMGASTGNMLVDNKKTLEAIFAESPVLIATHCEDESIIRANSSHYRERFGENVPVHFHPVIRSEEACFKSSSLAASLADKYNSRLHILHISTARELELFGNTEHRAQKKLTAEVCVHHLWFSNTDYSTKGNFIKWNPAIKTENDRLGLIQGLSNGKLDVVATDHAPHTLEEKANTYFKAPSGGPLVQHSLLLMLELSRKGHFSPEFVVDKMCHAPADLFSVDLRGYLREGYFADLVLIDPATHWTIDRENLRYKCGWSPVEGTSLHHKVETTFVNGKIVYDRGEIISNQAAQALLFNR